MGGCAAFCWLWRQGSLEGLEGGLWERRAGGAQVNSKDIQSQDPDSASHLNFPRAPAEEPCWPATRLQPREAQGTGPRLAKGGFWLAGTGR